MRLGKKIELTDSLGNPVQAILSIPENARAAVIMSHGFTSNKNSSLYVELEDELNNKGVGAVRYDYFGHGPAYGHTQGYAVSADTTLTKTTESLKAVIRYVRSKGDRKIGLVGSSFGGLVSLVATSQDPEIAALVLKSSVTDPQEFWRGRLGNEGIEQWAKEGVVHITQDIVDYPLDYGYWEDLQSYDTLVMVENISCPVLIIHGGKDTCVPIKQSRDLARVLGTKVEVFEEADHSYSNPGELEKLRKITIGFLEDKLS